MNQMKKGKNRALKLFAVFMLLLSVFSALPVSADVGVSNIPTQSYYYRQNSNGRKAVADRQVFDVGSVISGESLGITSFSGITDMYTADDGRIYLLDAGNNRVVVLNADFTLNGIVDTFVCNGEVLTLSEPQGIFVDKSGNMIIADTENMRLLFCTADGMVYNVISSPEGDLIPDDFSFYPIRCVQDAKGFTYILSRGSYYGALTYDENGEFCGFYGSNPVTSDILQQIEKIFKRIFVNNASAEYKVQKLPFQFSDLCIGSDDFIYTVSPNVSSRTGQVRKLSPAGDNILYYTAGTTAQNGDSINFGDEDIYVNNGNNRITQSFNGIAVDKSGYIYALDSSYGKVFVYDGDCNSITVFGGGIGTGDQKGTFTTATSIEIAGDSVLVSDSAKNTVTVFTRTEYGDKIYTANGYYRSGEFTEAEPYWQEIINGGSNFQLAFRGMASAAYAREDYKTALTYAKRADDQAVYAQAFEQLFNTFLAENLWWIALLAVLLIGGLVVLVIFLKKRSVVLVKNKKLRTALRAPFHPFASFYDVKYLKQKSNIISAVIIALFYVLTVLKSLWGGFMYGIVDESFNALLLLGGSVGLVVLFAVVNWAMCSLFEGKGTLGEVFCFTSFALIPQLIGNAFYIVASHFIVPSSSTIISSVTMICTIWTAVILIVGIISIHDFSFSKMIFTSVLTLVGIVLVVFVIFMVMTFFQNFISFIVSLYREVVSR